MRRVEKVRDAFLRAHELAEKARDAERVAQYEYFAHGEGFQHDALENARQASADAHDEAEQKWQEFVALWPAPIVKRIRNGGC